MEPWACFASRPVSRVRALPPTITDSRTNMVVLRSSAHDRYVRYDAGASNLRLQPRSLRRTRRAPQRAKLKSLSDPVPESWRQRRRTYLRRLSDVTTVR